MCSDTAITITDLHKTFRLYARQIDRIKQLLRPSRRYYTPFHALQGVSFSVKKGETVGIIGRNGSGKSTLLQIVCGTLTPTAGSVQVNGRVAALLELGAGFNPEFTGRENIYLNGAILGLSKEQIHHKLDAILAFADIGDHIDQPVKTYSSGMFVRLAFAVIAHVDADILIIDEALAVGDALFTQKCMRFLRGFKQNGGTILFVSHDSAAVISLCDRAVWLHKGTMRAIGDAKTVCEDYLAMLFNENASTSDTPPPAAPLTEYASPTEWVDQRYELIQNSSLRTDLEVFQFDPQQAGFGQGGAEIIDVYFSNLADQALNWVVGMEKVRLRVHVKAIKPLTSPIVGFYIKNRLGQELFGDNSYLSYADQPVSLQAGERLSACFEFIMPILPPGNYTIAVAIANGTQAEHEQHHWIHDAIVFSSHTQNSIHGLVGVPMQTIQLEKVKA